MFTYTNFSLYWDDLCLNEMKNITKNSSVSGEVFRIIKPDDSIVDVQLNTLTDKEHTMFEAFVDQFKEALVQYQSKLDLYKSAYITKLQEICNAEILSGFMSDAKGSEIRHYNFTYDDQINMIGIQNKIMKANMFNQLSSLVISWKNSNQIICDDDWTVDEFLNLCEDGENWKTSRIVKIHTLKVAINNATTFEEVDLVVW